jgi:hypothetical protein
MQQGRLTRKEVGERLICFGANGVSIFQSPFSKMPHYNGILTKGYKHSLYRMGQHCMAHKTNLVMQALSNLPVVSKLEELF